MDDTNQPIQPTQGQNSDVANELAHVTQEMYKKNYELLERNKALSLLRKIHDIILGSVTDVNQITQSVSDVIAHEAEFKAVIIYLLDKEKNELQRVAVSQTEEIAKIELQFNRSLFYSKIPLLEEINLVAKAVKNKKVFVTHNIFDLLVPHVSKEDAEKIQTQTSIKSLLLYPLIVRNDVIGVMIICLGESEMLLFQFQQDLIERLASVIGIALDNALLYKEIQAANEALKQIDKLKDEFVSLASHELRTPMTAIKSYLWLALSGRGGPVSDKLKQYLDRAYTSTDRLIKLVNDMLNVSRIESGRIILSIKPTDLNALIADTITEVLPRAQELGVNVSFVPMENIPYVQADPDKIKEIIINLIGNSLKFTPHGGNIDIAISMSNDTAVIKVADNGKGITSENMAKLFHKFGTFGSSYLTKQSAQGTGLGLYISKSLIELHGGKIWAESDGEGKGSRFFFTLRLAHLPPPQMQA